MKCEFWLTWEADWSKIKIIPDFQIFKIFYVETNFGESKIGASEIICDQSTCAVVCPDGFLPTGKRRTKCRWTKKKGFFWKVNLKILLEPNNEKKICV